MGLFNQKVSKPEMAALVVFWKGYMKSRKGYEAYLEEVRRLNKPIDFKMWLEYSEEKNRLFKELRKVIPEIGNSDYDNFWRDVVSLRPEAVIDTLKVYRRKKETEREQRNAEKQILAGSKKK